MTILNWLGFRRILALTTGVAWLSSACTVAASDPATPAWDTFSDTWVATDALGRKLPGTEETGPPRRNKTVGIFYFLWLDTRGPILDISKLLAANPANPQYGGVGAFHWWGEPLFGYYRADDEFVIRKHAQVLTDAGVDVVIFDVTNGFTYDETYLAICRVYAEMRRLGQKTPQIAFIGHSGEGRVAQALYDKFYGKGQFSDLWFRWQGKPLLLAKPEALAPPLREFFTARESWAWTKGHKWFADGKDKWAWLDNHPQNPGWHDNPQTPEHISVNVAQHPVSNIGRSFHNGKEPPPEQRAPEKGLCFDEQWRRALEVNPEFVFVTGWNEWIAQRFVSAKGGQTFLGRPLPPGGTFFVDQYNQEFSRDIEPMKGGHGDNYYYQLAANVRRYKGARPLPPVQRQSIQIDGSFDDWKDVQPEFRDAIGDEVRRNHKGSGDAGPYVNDTGRNDIIAAKASYDAQNIYFYVRTHGPLTAPTDPNWMLLFIDADQNSTNGWLGYDFVVNHTAAQARTATLEKQQGRGYQWDSPTKIEYRAAGNELELAIPRAALGLTRSPATLDFKWADNIQQTGDWSDFTLNGDAAPNDRFNFRAKLP